MKLAKLLLLILPILVFTFLACNTASKKDKLGNASRENKNGWVYVHLQGTPSDIGYQHGYLLANEIDTTIRVMEYFLEHETKKDWAFYRQATKNFIWNKLDKEYQNEINGIASGMQAKHLNYDSIDIAAYNAWLELAFYY